MFNFVASQRTISKIKQGSKYFTPYLGMAFTTEDKDGRKFRINDKEKFAKDYFEKSGRMAYSQGKIGSINFFVDHYITDSLVLCYYNDEEVAFEYLDHTAKEKGVDAYLGSMIKKVESIYAEEVTSKKENMTERDINQMPGDASKLYTNPGQVTYDDIKKYMQQKKNGGTKP
jgi:hypothetical protein